MARRNPTATPAEAPPRRLALLAGVLFVITFITAIPAMLLYDPVLNDPGYILGAGADTRVFLGASLELLLIIANVGTALALFPVLKRQNEGLALGYVAARVVECTFIAVGILSVLSIVTLRQDAAGADADSLLAIGQSLVAIHDWSFLFGPGFVVGVGNGLMLGYLMYRVGPGAAAPGHARARRRPSGLRVGDRRDVRRLRGGLRGSGPRDDPGDALGGVARHLPDRQGLQAVRARPR
jgi:hypothetical protein